MADEAIRNAGVTADGSTPVTGDNTQSATAGSHTVGAAAPETTAAPMDANAKAPLGPPAPPAAKPRRRRAASKTAGTAHKAPTSSESPTEAKGRAASDDAREATAAKPAAASRKAKAAASAMAPDEPGVSAAAESAVKRGAAAQVRHQAAPSVFTAAAPKAKHEGAAVMSALAANVVIALVKFIIGLFGVQAMMGEAIHSAADCINEVVLIKGKDASKNPPTRDHPLGTVRMQYLAGLAVAVIVCGLGGVYTIVEAFHKINSMVTAGPSAFDVDPKLLWISIIVAVAAACAEGWSLHKSYKEAQEAYRTTGGRGKFSAVKFWAGTKNSELTSVLAEDTLALVGLAFVVVGCAASLSTGNEIWDAISSMMIGFVLILGGLALAWQNTSLLLGEGVNNRTYDAIEAVLEANQDVERILREPVAWHESAYKIRCEIKVQLKSEKAMKKDKETAINDLEDQIRKALPSRYQVELWIEPDKYDPEIAKKADLSDHSDD